MEFSTRRGGGSLRGLSQQVEQRVVVDAREFRSALPFMLYQRDLKIEPVTIPVGDYVLSRDICVERKAIPDLIQSFQSGRLYQQAENLCQHYACPVLLVEFDPGRAFALLNCHTVANRGSARSPDLISKLVLLALHFPKLRLIWSPSQRFTADTFKRLKEGRHQPDVKSASIPDADDAAGTEKSGRRKANSAALDVLRKLPGVTPKNMHALAQRAGSLAKLADLSEEELTEVMGRVNAQQLHAFLHEAAVWAREEQVIELAAVDEAVVS